MKSPLYLPFNTTTRFKFLVTWGSEQQFSELFTHTFYNHQAKMMDQFAGALKTPNSLDYFLKHDRECVWSELSCFWIAQRYRSKYYAGYLGTSSYLPPTQKFKHLDFLANGKKNAKNTHDSKPNTCISFECVVHSSKPFRNVWSKEYSHSILPRYMRRWISTYLTKRLVQVAISYNRYKM